MRLLHKADLTQLPSDTMSEVRAKIIELITTLDECYGEDRTLDDDGGYVVYLPKGDNIEEAIKEIDFDFKAAQPEHIDTIKTANGDYVNVLYLFNNEYGVNLIMPNDKTLLSLCGILEGF